MELTKRDMKFLKGVAILFMLALHLFCRKEVNGLYVTFPLIHGVPLIYYIALFGDACVPIYCFASGYGLFLIHERGHSNVFQNNLKRILKLLINYWIVLAIFITVGFFAGKAEFPGSLLKFILNFFLLSNSYNGAWWFLQTYIILVLLTPLFNRLIKKYNSMVLLCISGVIYLLTYIQRIKQVIDLGDHAVLILLVDAIVLVGTSQLPFVVGAIFAKEKIYSKLYHRFYKVPFKNIFCAVGIIVLIFVHSVYESMIIAPFTAIVFICLFTLMNKNLLFEKILDFFGDHSTNIWLTHMFFYMSIFPVLTFFPRYPIAIFVWLLTMCLASSFVINSMYKPILRIIDKRRSIVHSNGKAQLVNLSGRKS
jgi:surface polysaccharide O-acyltransferase-like enzyme